MLLDWFTVIAQILNFLVLVLLLRWLLYKPVLRIMRQRQEAIETEWSAARQQQLAASQSEAHFHRQVQDLEQTRSERLAAMHAAIAEEKQHLLQEVRAELARQRQSWQEQLHREIESSETALTQVMAKQVIEAVRQTLSELATADLENQLIRVFVDQLSALDAARWAQWRSGDPAPTVVALRTTFELSAAQRQTLEALVSQHLDQAATLSFSLAPELLLGIELRLAGHTIGWNLADELQGLQDRLSSSLAAP